ncbi:unnamed protein product [Phaedon cochleariae]|uniref:Tetratricopeptide repeat protein n=1 Tax=Phaedon cochleariae TaxID=80249 RepID=A0A9N9X3K7_PHACE|nr:unnamed protein product [Phaedon cochleariae]
MIAISSQIRLLVWKSRGEIEREEGKLQDALESFQACLKLIPRSANALKEVAKCLFEMRRFKLSMEAYLEAESASHTPDWQIYYHLGICFLKLGDINKAKEYAHRAVQVSKQESCYALLMKILVSQGDHKSAIAVANAAVE